MSPLIVGNLGCGLVLAVLGGLAVLLARRSGAPGALVGFILALGYALVAAQVRFLPSLGPGPLTNGLATLAGWLLWFWLGTRLLPGADDSLIGGHLPGAGQVLAVLAVAVLVGWWRMPVPKIYNMALLVAATLGGLSLAGPWATPRARGAAWTCVTLVLLLVFTPKLRLMPEPREGLLAGFKALAVAAGSLLSLGFLRRIPGRLATLPDPLRLGAAILLFLLPGWVSSRLLGTELPGLLLGGACLAALRGGSGVPLPRLAEEVPALLLGLVVGGGLAVGLLRDPALWILLGAVLAATLLARGIFSALVPEGAPATWAARSPGLLGLACFQEVITSRGFAPGTPVAAFAVLMAFGAFAWVGSRREAAGAVA